MKSTARQTIERYGEAFARAFAVFVREVVRGDAEPKALHADHSEGSPAGTPNSDIDDDEPLMRELAQAIKENEALARAGKLEVFEVTDESASRAMADRLRWIIKDRGLTQKKLAEKVGVTPAKISHVLRNPDGSKIETLRKIARALEIDLGKIL